MVKGGRSTWVYRADRVIVPSMYRLANTWGYSVLVYNLYIISERFSKLDVFHMGTMSDQRTSVDMFILCRPGTYRLANTCGYSVLLSEVIRQASP